MINERINTVWFFFSSYHYYHEKNTNIPSAIYIYIYTQQSMTNWKEIQVVFWKRCAESKRGIGLSATARRFCCGFFAFRRMIRHFYCYYISEIIRKLGCVTITSFLGNSIYAFSESLLARRGGMVRDGRWQAGGIVLPSQNRIVTFAEQNPANNLRVL